MGIHFRDSITSSVLKIKDFKMMVDASIQPEIPMWYGPGAAEVSTGTTLVAMEFADGVVLAADSRTSTGSFVAVRVTDKLTPVTSHIMACRSGSAADTQAMTDIVKNQLEWYEIEFGNPPPVHTAAHLFKNISYDYRDQLTAGFIDANYKENMKKDECVELAKKAVTLAINLDGSSGGCCRIAIITKDGVERKLFLNNELDAIGEFSY